MPGGLNAGPYTWSLAGGSLPTGITLSSAGRLTGSCNVDGEFNFTVQVADVNGCVNVRSFTLHVAAAARYDGVMWMSTFGSGIGYLETYNLSTGEKKMIGVTADTSNHKLSGLAWSQSDKLYGLEFISSSNSKVYEVNPNDGSVTFLGSLNGSFNSLVFRGMHSLPVVTD